MKRRALIGAGAAALATAASLLVGTGTANAASATGSFLKFEVCASGNYTAYGKYVEHTSSGDLTAETPHVAAGTCASTLDVVRNVEDSITIWLFGVYNVSHQGFSLGKNGGPIAPSGNSIDVTTVLLHANGTTTSPSYTYKEWFNDGTSVSG